MKKIFLILVCSLFLIASKAQEAVQVHKFTLEQCLDYALQKNYNLQSMKLTEEAKEDALQQSKMERLPDLNASLNETFSNSKANPSSWTGNYGLNAGIVLYQGGSIENTIKQNKLLTEQSKYQTSQYENELTVQILQAFLTVLGNEELLKYQEVVANASEEQLKQGKEQFRMGSILESDYMMLEAQYANDKNNISDTKINLDNSLLALKNLLSMHPSEEIQIIYPDTSSFTQMAIIPEKEYVMEKAFQTMPTLKISQYNVNIANVSTKLAKSGYFPSLSLSGGMGTGHVNGYSDFGTQLSDRLNEQVGLNLTVPIFNNNRVKSKVTQSRIALQQAELDQKQTELDVAQNVATEYQNVVSAYNKYKTTDIRQNAYLKTFEAYRAQFNAGAITAVDLLQQQNNYISALNDYIQSKYGFILKRKILDVYMGIPVKM